jgi:hypothetical protein
MFCHMCVTCVSDQQSYDELKPKHVWAQWLFVPFSCSAQIFCNLDANSFTWQVFKSPNTHGLNEGSQASQGQDSSHSNRVKMIAHGDTFGEDITFEVQHVRGFFPVKHIVWCDWHIDSCTYLMFCVSETFHWVLNTRKTWFEGAKVYFGFCFSQDSAHGSLVP